PRSRRRTLHRDRDRVRARALPESIRSTSKVCVNPSLSARSEELSGGRVRMKRVASVRRRSMLACLSAISIAVMPAPPLAPLVTARMTGITGYSGKQGGLYCSNAPGCHSTTSMTRPPLVRFDGPTQVDPGAEVTYHFIVTSQAPELQIQAGFNVAVSDGEL